ERGQSFAGSGDGFAIRFERRQLGCGNRIDGLSVVFWMEATAAVPWGDNGRGRISREEKINQSVFVVVRDEDEGVALPKTFGVSFGALLGEDAEDAEGLEVGGERSWSAAE